MGLLKAVIYLVISIVLSMFLTQNNNEFLKKIPVLGEYLTQLENIQFLIIIFCFFFLTLLL